LLVPALALAPLTACGNSDKPTASGEPSKAVDTGPGKPHPKKTRQPTGPDTPGPSTPGPETGAPEQTDSPPGQATVPVYFVGQTPQGLRLYREFRLVDASDAQPEAKAVAAEALEALSLMASGNAIDPDYTTLFPGGGGFTSVEIGDDMITVGLADNSWADAPAGMSPAKARLAAQQMVYTLQGVAGKRLPVSIRLKGAPADLFGLAGEVSADDELDVRALVNITTPSEAATVSGTLNAEGVSSSFEATTPWEIRQGGPEGKVVLHGTVTAQGWADKLYPWHTEIDVSGLEPGRYVFVAMTDDPSGGEGHGPMIDTKSITVQAPGRAGNAS
jgi:hypothetical protein